MENFESFWNQEPVSLVRNAGYHLHGSHWTVTGWSICKLKCRWTFLSLQSSVLLVCFDLLLAWLLSTLSVAQSPDKVNSTYSLFFEGRWEPGTLIYHFADKIPHLPLNIFVLKFYPYAKKWPIYLFSMLYSVLVLIFFAWFFIIAILKWMYKRLDTAWVTSPALFRPS